VLSSFPLVYGIHWLSMAGLRMLVLRLLFATAAFCAPPASACVVAPPPVEKFWSHVPRQVEPGESVLEIQYLGPWFEPSAPGEDRVVVTDCLAEGIHHYRVTRVLRGEFRDEEILIPFRGGGVVGEFGNSSERHIVVGRLAAYYSSGGFNEYPPKPKTADQGPFPSKPLFYARSPSS
jgi:hypothetical protein